MDAGMTMARFNMAHGTNKVCKGTKNTLNDRYLLLNFFVIEQLKVDPQFFAARKLRPFKTCAMVLDMRGRTIRVLNTEPAEGVYFEMGLTARIRSSHLKDGAST